MDTPVAGEVWVHKNGGHYRILMLTNTQARLENAHKYPVTVVYQTVGFTNAIWSRPLHTWHESFHKKEG